MEHPKLSRRTGLEFWKRAWKERPVAKLWTPWRAVPGLVIAVVQWAVSRVLALGPPRSVKEMYIVAAIIIGVYFLLYALETSWNVAVVSPVILDLKSQDELKSKEHSELRKGMSGTVISFRVELDKTGSLLTIPMDRTVSGGTSQRFYLSIPRVRFVIWKRPSAQDLEVTIVEYSLDYLGPAGHPPTIPIHCAMRESEEVDVTERLVRFIGGDPFNPERLLRFSCDIRAVLGYEVVSKRAEASTNFRVTGNVNANTLQLEIQNLPNPPSATSGQ